MKEAVVFLGWGRRIKATTARRGQANMPHLDGYRVPWVQNILYVLDGLMGNSLLLWVSEEIG